MLAWRRLCAEEMEESDFPPAAGRRLGRAGRCRGWVLKMDGEETKVVTAVQSEGVPAWSCRAGDVVGWPTRKATGRCKSEWSGAERSGAEVFGTRTSKVQEKRSRVKERERERQRGRERGRERERDRMIERGRERERQKEE